MAILGFARREIAEFYRSGSRPRHEGWTDLAAIALRKLDMLAYAHTLGDLRSPPGNRLEPLTGELDGYYSVRINDRWRIIFRWTEQGPTDVDIVDYH